MSRCTTFLEHGVYLLLNVAVKKNWKVDQYGEDMEKFRVLLAD